MTPISTIRADLVQLLQTADASAKISFDPMTADEIGAAYIVSQLEIRHRDRQLDMAYYRTAAVTLTAVAKTTAALDALVDALAAVNNENQGSLRNAEISSILYKTDVSPDVKIAEVTLEAWISDYPEA